MPGLLATFRREFGSVSDPINPHGFSQACVPAVFTLQFPALLQFGAAMCSQEEPAQPQDLKSLFRAQAVPFDACMRERLDCDESLEATLCINARRQHGDTSIDRDILHVSRTNLSESNDLESACRAATMFLVIGTSRPYGQFDACQVRRHRRHRYTRYFRELRGSGTGTEQ